MKASEIQQQLEAAITECKQLKNQVSLWQAKIDEAQARIRNLSGGTFSRDQGLIGKLKQRLEEASLLEADESLPTVIWSSPPRGDDRYVVSRVTPKRIYIRRAGQKQEDIYTKDGKPVAFSYHEKQINVEATLGKD